MESKDNASSTSGGEASADYMISESGEQQQGSTQTTKGKKSGLESVTDTLKEKISGTARSIKEGVSSTVGTNNETDDRTKDLESSQVHQDSIAEASSDPKTAGPTDKVREKAAQTTDENQDSEEPA